VRTGTSASAINVAETVAALHAAGAAAVTVHGRTAEQRYRRPADWGAVAAVAAAGSGPVIGNGDILTHYEARRAPRTALLSSYAARCCKRDGWQHMVAWQLAQELHTTAVTGASAAGDTKYLAMTANRGAYQAVIDLK